MKTIIKLVSLLFFFISIDSTFANMPRMEPYDLDFSEDGKLVYINWGYQKDPITLSSEEAGKYKLSKNEFSQENYPQSGLYLIKDRKFLWKVEDQYYGVPLSDQEHLVAHHRWANYDALSFSLYHKNKLIRSFTSEDFCSNGKGSEYIWRENYKLDNSKKVITFFSCRKNFSVDVQTGDISFKRQYLMFEDIYNIPAILAFCSFWTLPIFSIIKIYMSCRKKGSVKQRKNISRIIIVMSFILLGFIFLILPFRHHFVDTMFR